MAVEIERKFLVLSGAYQGAGHSTLYRQAYLSFDKSRTVRIRTAGDKAYLTVKGESAGMSRAEFEYEIPLNDAVQMIDELCHKPAIEKVRTVVSYKGHVWEVDEFHGENEGLVVAEIELKEESESFEKPEWIGLEVTDDHRYSNSNLSRNPYCGWKNSQL